MKSTKIIAFLTLALFVSTFGFVNAQSKSDTTKAHHKMMMKMDHNKMKGMMKDSTAQHKMHDMKMMKESGTNMSDSCSGKKDDSCCKSTDNKKETSVEKTSSIVRNGEINLTAIDENKDGKVFQDPMDWNVISDKAGECPLCGMDLKEVTLEKAKENLIKHHFKVKN